MARNENDYIRFRSRSDGYVPPTPGASFGSISGDFQFPDSTMPPSPDFIPDFSSAPPGGDLTIEQLLAAPGHDSLPRLDPARPPGTFWFDDDGSVAGQIRTIFERDFKEPHANWTQTPDYVITRWFKSFAQSYHWDVGITALVRSEFEAKLKYRMRDQIGRWKNKWKKDGDIAKPKWMEQQVWQGLVNFWRDPKSEIRSNNSRAARLSDPDGYGPHKHRSGQKSFRARARMIAEKTGDPTPDYLAVLEETKRRPDGSFMDSKSEKLYNEVTSRMEELTQNSDDPESMASVTQTPSFKNKIFSEVAPRKKGKIFGTGSLQSRVEGSVLPSTYSQSDPSLKAIVDDQAKQLAEARDLIKEQQTLIKTQQQRMDDLFRFWSRKDQEFATTFETPTTQDPGSGSGAGVGSGEPSPS